MAPQTPLEVFVQRRRSLLARLEQAGLHMPCALVSGWARPRNFCHSHFPFRAESHFLFLIGQHIEGALLILEPGQEPCLYMEPPDPEAALWTGVAPSLSQWETRLGLRVKALEEWKVQACAAIPPQDEASATWMSDLLDREILAQSGPELVRVDAAFADVLVAARLEKDEAALAQMRYAAQVSAEAHILGMRATKQSSREAQIRGVMEGHFISQDLTTAYTSIVTTAGNVLHAESSKGSLEQGALLLCDVGCESPEGFAGDISRTWPVSGRFTSSQRAIYEMVLQVQKSAIKGVQAGAQYADLHRQALAHTALGLKELGIFRATPEACVESGAVNVFFPHGLGHLLGLDVHDMEDLGDRAGYEAGVTRGSDPLLHYLRLSRVLSPGMVLTIEPGFYQIPQLLDGARADSRISEQIDWARLQEFEDVCGIRIEDDVLVGAKAAEVLSAHAPKEVQEIEELMA